MWVSTIISNASFIQDGRVNATNLSEASKGDLSALKEILEVYLDYVDCPKPPAAVNVAPNAPEHRERLMFTVVPVAERKQSISEMISLIESGELKVV